MVWMDLEMTGLDPAKEVIVEIATLITDDELNIIAEGPDLVVHQPEHLLAAMDPFVVNMHTKSGLLNEIRTSTLSLEEAGRITLDFIKSHVGAPKTVPLCGNSIGTDRMFLNRYMPALDQHLHYRNIDVSSIKELTRRWFPKAYFGAPAKTGNHRALGDIQDSIAELAYYRQTVFISAQNEAPTTS